MTDQSISRRLFSAAGLAALGTAVLGPRDALAQQKKKRRKRLQRMPQQQAVAPEELPPVTGLELDMVVMRDADAGLYVELYLLNHSENAYPISEPKFDRELPTLTIHAFGQRFEMDTVRALITPDRRAMISRAIPWRNVTLAPKNKRKREPSRFLYGRFVASWPKALRAHIQDLAQVPSFVSAEFQHSSLEERGLAQPLLSDHISLANLPERPAPKIKKGKQRLRALL